MAAAAAAPPPLEHGLGDGGSSRRKRLAVFVSGGGSNFKAIHSATQDGRIHADVAVVVASKPDCGGAAFAAERAIPTLAYPSEAMPPERLLQALQQQFSCDFLIMAGFLKLLPGARVSGTRRRRPGCTPRRPPPRLQPAEVVVRAYERRVLNIHPALLPSFGGKGFYGARVHEAVIASGARLSGPTVHFVDAQYDRGTRRGQAAAASLLHPLPLACLL